MVGFNVQSPYHHLYLSHCFRFVFFSCFLLENDQEEGHPRKEQERKLSPLSTLESSFSSLNVKKFDAAFASLSSDARRVFCSIT
ncbi:hypothetical protein HAX54_030295 [Datura stramonium]|uniref:Uncharacterized protein n=1 Tax=Datura stramonium TaxID=4076 RepID=A0ABS8SAV5_DATST|nr:hypothetical protein [Datura stramonium]